MPEARVPRLQLAEAKAAADEAGVPDYMAELSIFQVLLNHPTLARAVNDCSRRCSGTAVLHRGCGSW